MAHDTELDDRGACPTVEQQIPVDGSPDEVWEQLAAPDGLDWLGDDVEIDLVPGGTGHVVDGGVRREVLVTAVGPAGTIGWHWWSDGRAPGSGGAGGDLSSVQVTLHPIGDDPARTLVRVVETLAAPAGAPRAHASAFGTSAVAIRLVTRTPLVITC